MNVTRHDVLSGHVISRRSFVKWAASVSALAVAGPERFGAVSLLGAGPGDSLQPGLLPTQKEVWDQQLWMAKLGPKYTGNQAHTSFVEFLATEMKKLGLDVAREGYTLPRWDARRWEISIDSSAAQRFKAPVTSFFPYSGQTPTAGVTGELVYAGTNRKFTLDGLQGKVVLIGCPTNTRKVGRRVQGLGPEPGRRAFPDLDASRAPARRRRSCSNWTCFPTRRPRHLGSREWMDDASSHYRDTGHAEWSVAITPSRPMGELLVEALQGSRDRAGVVNPVGGGFLGEGSSLSRAGVPTIGYIPQPNYLLAGPANGCIEKLSPELLHSQIQVFAKLIHKIDAMSAAQLKA